MQTVLREEFDGPGAAAPSGPAMLAEHVCHCLPWTRRCLGIGRPPWQAVQAGGIQTSGHDGEFAANTACRAGRVQSHGAPVARQTVGHGRWLFVVTGFIRSEASVGAAIGCSVRGDREQDRMNAVTSALVSVFGWRGESPLQVCTLRPVTESNCVLVKGGGEQLEVNEQSVGERTRFGRADRRAC